MKIKKGVALLLCVMLVTTLVGFAPASAGQPISNITDSYVATESAATSFAREEIRHIVEESPSNCIWNETTDICSSIALYDYDDVCIGYVFKLSTDGGPTGYIQVNNINNELVTYCYSFNGKPAYEGLATNEGSSLASSDDKLYFFGNFAYCTKLTNGNFSPLDSVEEFSVHDVAAFYHDFLNHANQCKEECDVTSESTASLQNTTSMHSTQSFSLVTTSDFSNLYATRPNGTRQRVTQHCSPTAATNIMLYFRSTGDSPLSSSVSNSTIFMELYYAMDTNSISSSNEITATGTQRANIKPGISSFCSGRNCTPSSLGKASSVTFSGMKNHLNDGELLLISLDDFTNEGSKHSVVAFDYSGNNLSLSTGWDTDYHLYLYSGLSIGQYVYVGY